MAETKSKKAWYKKWWVIVLFAIIAVVIVGSITGNNSPPASSSNSPETVHNLGDEIQAGDFKWKILKSATAKAISSLTGELLDEKQGGVFQQNADGMYLILDVEVENTATSAKYLTASFVRLVDDQNREFEPDISAAFYLKPEGSALESKLINPGIKKKGRIIYDVPEGLKMANVTISSDLIFSETYKVKLTI